MTKKTFLLSILLVVKGILFSQEEFVNNIVTQLKEPDQYINFAESDKLIIPWSIKYNKYNKNIYLIDKYNKIVILDSTLNILSEFGQKGQGPGEFNIIGDINIFNNNLYVYDMFNMRIQIFDENGKYISVIRPKETMFKVKALDFEKRIYTYLYKPETLYTVYNSDNKVLESFGKLHKSYQSKMVQYTLNDYYTKIDKNNNIYCVFIHYPILRKYDSNFKLVFEINYKNLDEVKNALDRYERNKEKTLKYKNLPPEVYEASREAKYISNAMSIDNKYIYILFENNSIVIFDKNNGRIVKRLHLNCKNSKDQIKRIDASSEHFIYAVCEESLKIFIFPK